MPIEIIITAETSDVALAEMEAMLRSRMRQPDMTDASGPAPTTTTEAAAEPTRNEEDASSFRPRGAAGEGRKRRTKSEIQEDEELEKLAAAAGIPLEKVDKALADTQDRGEVLRQLKARLDNASEEKPQISENPEDRHAPDDETAEDDAAEAEAKDDIGLDGPKKVTMEDIREAAGAYDKKWGRDKLVKLIRETLGYANMSAIANAGEDKWPGVYEALTQEL